MATVKIGPAAVISAVMIILGLFVAGRLLVRPEQPLTGTVLLDAAFALFFIARGAIYFWTLRLRSRV